MHGRGRGRAVRRSSKGRACALVLAVCAVTIASAMEPAVAKTLESVTRTLELRGGWNAIALDVDAPIAEKAALLREAGVVEIVVRRAVLGAHEVSGGTAPIEGPQWAEEEALWRATQVQAMNEGYEQAAERLVAGRCYMLRATRNGAQVTLTGAPMPIGTQLRGRAGAVVALSPDRDADSAVTARQMLQGEEGKAEIHALSADRGWVRIEDWDGHVLDRSECLLVRKDSGDQLRQPVEVHGWKGRRMAISEAIPEEEIRIINHTRNRATVTIRSTPVMLESGQRPALLAQLVGGQTKPGANTQWVGLEDSAGGGLVVELEPLGAATIRVGANLPALKRWHGGGETPATVDTVLKVRGGGIARDVAVRVTLGAVWNAHARAGLWVGNALVEAVGTISRRRPKTRHGPSSGNALNEKGDEIIGEGEPESVTEPYPIRLIVHWAAPPKENGAWQARCRLLSDAIVVGEGESSVVVTDEEEALKRIAQRKSARVVRFRTAGYVVEGTREAEDSGDECLAPGSTVRFTIRLPHDHPLHPDVHAAHPQHDNLDPGYQTKLDPGVESRALVRTMTLKVRAEDDAAGQWWSDSQIEGLYAEEIEGAVRIGAEDPPVLRVVGRFMLTRVSTAKLETER